MRTRTLIATPKLFAIESTLSKIHSFIFSKSINQKYRTVWEEQQEHQTK
jgi:hypothetical protein